MTTPGVGTGNSVIAPAGVMRPILPARSVNQRLPSGPTVMPSGVAFAVGIGNSATSVPVVVTLPILLPLYSVNQRLPSGPTARPLMPLASAHHRELGDRPRRGDPADLARVEHREPEVAVGPRHEPEEPAGAAATGNSVITPAGVIRPILVASVNHTLPSGPAVIE